MITAASSSLARGPHAHVRAFLRSSGEERSGPRHPSLFSKRKIGRCINGAPRRSVSLCEGTRLGLWAGLVRSRYAMGAEKNLFHSLFLSLSFSFPFAYFSFAPPLCQRVGAASELLGSSNSKKKKKKESSKRAGNINKF